jgi:hypothetical protein
VSEIIASFTAEQTAEFFSGGELGKPTIHDPRTRERMERQRQDLLAGFESAVGDLVRSLRRDSPRTADRLQQLWGSAKSGNPEARRLFPVMVAELAKQALIQ